MADPRDVVADLANAMDAALEVRDARIGWAGAYDHGNPPTALDIASGILPRLRQLGYEVVPATAASQPAARPIGVDERNWLAGEGTIAAAMGGERLMARDPLVKAAYDRGRSDGALYGPER